MPLTLMYITNHPVVALIAEKSGVDRIWIDLETMGKEERQKGINSVKSHHTIHDIEVISKLLTKSELMARINPWNENSKQEIEEVITAGAERIMLPMWKTEAEVDAFLRTVNRRVATTLLLETKEAAESLDAVLENPLLDEIHIGLNDLHLSYDLTFMFELLSNGVVERLCKKMSAKGISYGFGGVARIGEGALPAERVVMEHYRLGSTRAILSRSFCNTDEISDVNLIERLFNKNMILLREFEGSVMQMSNECFVENMQIVETEIKKIAARLKGDKKQ